MMCTKTGSAKGEKGLTKKKRKNTSTHLIGHIGKHIIHALYTPETPFYIVKLEYTGVYSLIFASKHRLWALNN